MLLSSTAGVDQRLTLDQGGYLQLLRPSAANNRKHSLSGLHSLWVHLQHRPLRSAFKHNRRESHIAAYNQNSSHHSGLKTYKIVVVPESTSVETFLTQVHFAAACQYFVHSGTRHTFCSLACIHAATLALQHANAHSLNCLYTQVQNGRIDLQPEYQRDFEWQQPACSKIIETVLLQVPFQEVWLHEQPNFKRNVVDGQQRLTTLRAFRETRLPNGQTFKLQVAL